MTLIIKSIFTVFELAIVFIYSVISQMNEHIVYISLIQASRFELFCCEPHDSLMI
jgi:hypothetical protein